MCPKIISKNLLWTWFYVGVLKAQKLTSEETGRRKSNYKRISFKNINNFLILVLRLLLYNKKFFHTISFLLFLRKNELLFTLHCILLLICPFLTRTSCSCEKSFETAPAENKYLYIRSIWSNSQIIPYFQKKI